MKIKFYNYKIFIVFAFFWGHQMISQTETEFYKLSGEGISPQSITYAIKQDSLGVLWIATEEGVLKFDSKKFKLYNTYNGLPPMVSNRTQQIFIDSKQRIWLGMEKAVCLYNKNMDKFELVGDTHQINPAYVKAIIEDDEYQLWFGAYNGLWKLDKNFHLKQFLPEYKIYALLAYQNSILIGTPKGLFIFKKDKGEIHKISLDKDDNIRSLVYIDRQILAGANSGRIYKITASNLQAKLLSIQAKITKPVFDIVKDNYQHYFIGTDGDGLYKFDYNFKLLNHYVEDPNNPHSLSSNGIYDLEIGKEPILWIATYGGGVNYMKLAPLPFHNIRHKINSPNSIMSNFTRAISVDSLGNIWFGTKNGISIWNPKKNVWKQLHLNGKNPKKQKTIVLSLEPDGKYMWVGTYGDGLYKVNILNYKQIHNDNLFLPGLSLSKIYTLLKDSKHNLWVGGIEGNLTIIRPQLKIDTYPITDVKTIIEGNDGNIIIGARNGVYTINDSLHQFNHLQGLMSDEVLANSKVNAIYQDSKNRLILGTNGAGLIYFDSKNQSKHIINMSKGLPSDIVQGILAVNDNNLWLSTSKGLVHILTTPNDTIIHKYDKNDGLASTEFNFGSFAKINDSLLAFGGTNGVSLFNPKKITEKIPLPTVVFDEFKLSNKVIKPGEKPLKIHINQTKEIKLKHNQNSFEIRFTGILQNNPSQVKYSWKLVGFDETWSSPRYVNFATYTNLNPGDYTFEVKAFNKYGLAGPVRKINFTIATPWWAKNIAFLLYALLISVIFILVIKFTSFIVNKKHVEQQIEFFNNITHEIKTPLAVLISSLDNITQKLDSDEPVKKRIKSTVNRINSLFEQMLNYQRITSNDFYEDDVEKINIDVLINNIINNFTPLIKKQDINVTINNNWGDVPFYFNKEILEKILQNLISNAIKYSFEKGKIIINLFKTKQGELKMEIIDEGLGIPKDQQKFILNRYYRARNVINSQRPGTGLGLIMVKKLINKTGGQIKFESKENKGTTFIIILKNLQKKFKKKSSVPDILQKGIKLDLEDSSELEKFKNVKILVVEDNNDLRQSLVETLSRYFYVYEANNGKEGLEISRQIHPDIILTDLIMPEMDGMQMSQLIKEDINLNHIPIFMLTVLNNSTQKLKSAEAGISTYIEKPVNLKYLLAKILNTLKYQKKLREKYIHENDLNNAEIFKNKNDQEFIKKLENIILEKIEENNFSVHNLAEGMGMSRTSLYMKLKNLVDLSPQDFIIHTRLKMAKKLLIENNLSIKEVAYSSGFSNPKYFSTVFKKFYKMSPRQFLESLKKSKQN